MASTYPRPRSAADYTVACICPMGVEFAPVEAMLDDIYDPIPLPRDQNAYTLGRIGVHNVVVAVMPEIGNNSAAIVATQILNDFQSIRFCLLVGIGGGVPGAVDVRLGDVVVSQATDTFGGVVQYDLGKRMEGGQFRRTGYLNKPPQILSANVRKLEGRHRREGNQIQHLLMKMLDRYPRMREEYAYPVTANDDLFRTSYSHISGTTCDGCDRQHTITRPARSSKGTYIHYGTIGSANVVVKDAVVRDELQRDMNLVCVEMEAAGLVDSFPCLVIRGICDYADTHKNKQWQPYAAAVAAAYMKELLLHVPAREITRLQYPGTNPTTESFNKHFEVPHLLSPVFTGQEDICQNLDTCLTLNSAPRRSCQRRFVLYGLGGSGKTQICLRYAQRHRDRYWGIFWVDASTVSNIQRSFAQMADLLHIQAEVDQVKRALTNTTQPWLLMFDNADNPQISLSEYFPAGERGDLIITSRNPNCRIYQTVGYHELGPMRNDDSLSLLFKIIYGHSDAPERERQHGKEVVAALGHLALAVAQAGAYIRETSCTFDHYLELWRRRRQELLQYSPQHSGTDYRHTVFTSWQVSLDRIESIQDIPSLFALQILRLFCFFHHDRVPLAMFEHAWQTSQRRNMDVTEWAVWPETISDTFSLRHLVQMSVALLASYSLVYQDLGASPSLSLHPLVREWCQIRLDEQERQSSYRKAIALIATSAVQKNTVAAYAYRRLLTPHINACVHASDTCGQLDSKVSTRHWEILASVLADNGFPQDASQLSEQVVRFYKSELGDDHLNTIRSVHELAVYYCTAGRQNEALQLTEYVVQLCKSKLGDDHPITIRSMGSLANRYHDAGRQDEALKLIEYVVQFYKSTLGDDNPTTIHSMGDLAIHQSEAGRQDEALQLTEHVVQFYKRTHGDDHPTTISVMSNLANRYREVGRQDEALQLTEYVVQLSKSTLGDCHPTTIIAMHNLTTYCYIVGRQDEALPLAEHVVQFYKRTLGDDHPDTVFSMGNLASLYRHVGRQDEALQLMEHVVQCYKSKLGDRHPITVISMYNLAIQYGDVGRIDEAPQLAEEALPLFEAKFGDSNGEALESKSSPDDLCHTTGKDALTEQPVRGSCSPNHMVGTDALTQEPVCSSDQLSHSEGSELQIEQPIPNLGSLSHTIGSDAPTARPTSTSKDGFCRHRRKLLQRRNNRQAGQ